MQNYIINLNILVDRMYGGCIITKKNLLYLIAYTMMLSSAIGQEDIGDYWMERADGFFGPNFAEAAVRCYDKVIEHDSTNLSAWYKKGIMLASQFKQNKSLEAFDFAVNLEPNNSKVWNAKGIGHYLIARLDRYIEDQLIDLNSDAVAINDDKYIKTFKGSVKYKKTWESAFDISPETRRIAAVLNTKDNYSELAIVLENPRGEPYDALLGNGILGPISVETPEIGQWKIRVYGNDIPKEIESAEFEIRFINQAYQSDRFNRSLDALENAIRLDESSLTPVIQKAEVLMESGQFKESNETIMRL